MRKITIALCAFIALSAAPAAAQRTSPLEGQPAVRKRLLLRENRIELVPMAGFALNRDFFHTILGGIKAQYHVNDYFSVGIMFAGGILNLKTGLTNNILDQLPQTYDSSTPTQLVPSKDMALKPMLRLQYLAGGEVQTTPFFGKMALFGKLFFNYDFYGFVGFGAAGMADDCKGNCKVTYQEQVTVDYTNQTKGFRPGGTFGLGFHFFFNNWIALNVELRDTVVRDNLSGRDINWDPQKSPSGQMLLPPAMTDKDVAWDNIFTVFLGASFYLPSSISSSR
jgi:outer membrane beta-barrel protein